MDLAGNYTATIPSPTGIAADPALTSHGLKQAKELGKHLTTVDPPIDVVFSSPYYRCLQTIDPFVQFQQDLQKHGQLPHSATSTTKIRPESGFCEWFGSAPFNHPQPAEADDLKSLVPSYDEEYKTALIPSIKGETYAQLRDRVASALAAVIAQCDAEGKKTMVLCTHAAVVIVLGRILTGEFPESMDEEDFRAFTCGLSVYKRITKTTSTTPTGSEGTFSPLKFKTKALFF